MTDDYVKSLESLREKFVSERRQTAPYLLKPYDRETTPQLESRFIETQSLIDAVDRAIDDESRLRLTGSAVNPVSS